MYALKILLTKKQRLVLKYKMLNFVFELNTKDGELSKSAQLLKYLKNVWIDFSRTFFISFYSLNPVNFFISSPQCYTCYAMLRMMLRNVIVSFWTPRPWAHLLEDVKPLSWKRDCVCVTSRNQFCFVNFTLNLYCVRHFYIS